MTPEEKLANLRELATLVTYDPETGIVTWKKREGDDKFTKSWNTRYAGKVVGRKKRSYRMHDKIESIQVWFGEKSHMIHHLIWVIVHDKLPEHVIDHINGDATDNRLENLRDVTRQQNNKNTKKSRANTSGESGVFWDKRLKKWHARIMSNGKAAYHKYFSDFDEAVRRVKQARIDLGFSERHGT